MIFWIIRLVAQLLLVILFQLLPAVLFTLLWAVTFMTRLLMGIGQPWRDERQRQHEQQAEVFSQEQYYRHKRRVVGK